MHEVIFKGTSKIGKINYLNFQYNKKAISIPVPENIAIHVMLYLNKYIPEKQESVEPPQI